MIVKDFFRTWTIKDTDSDPVANIGGTISFSQCDQGHVHCETSPDFSSGDWDGTAFRYDPTTGWLSGGVKFGPGNYLYIIVSITGDETRGFKIKFRDNARNSPGGDASGDDTGNN